MKKYIKYLLFLFVTCFLYGCGSKVPLEDTSYETELFGAYEGYMDRIQLGEDYTLSTEYTNGDINNSYTSKYEVIEINDNILKLVYHNNHGEESVLFKYKNMLGYYNETANTIPKSKHFDIGIPSSFDDYEGADNHGWIFTKDGLFHNCDNIDNCTCNEEKTFFLPYERKDDVIYVNATPEETEAYWQVLFYVVDGGLFESIYYKIEE